MTRAEKKMAQGIALGDNLGSTSAPVSVDSQPPVTPVPGNPTPSSSLYTHSTVDKSPREAEGNNNKKY